MENKEEIERIISEKLKPYEEKISNLEELDQKKDEEIDKMKNYIYEFHRVMKEIEEMDLPN
jgi:hypothetical protein